MSRSLVVLSLLLIAVTGKTQAGPDVYLFPFEQIALIKKKVDAGDGAVKAWTAKITAEADKILPLTPGSVMEKNFLPPNGNKHDYMSLAPYFWPDLSRPDSLPYIRKDGQRNPMIDKISDKQHLVDLGHHTFILALAYAFTGEEKYAKKSISYMHTWFVDPATKMNPNLTYAQAVMGVNDGRGIGIIETIALTNVVDAIGLLDRLGVFPKAELATIDTWYSSYLDWMLTSKNGTDERKALNNHGIWYDMQVLSFSLFLHRETFARDYLRKTTLPRIAVQFEPDGKQPLELERTTALGYSTFSLEAWFKTAIMADKAGVDIWHYTTPDGRNIRKALDWLIPFATGEQPWTYQQIKPYTEIDKMYFLLIEAAKYYKDNSYLAVAEKLKPGDMALIKLLYALK